MRSVKDGTEPLRFSGSKEGKDLRPGKSSIQWVFPRELRSLQLLSYLTNIQEPGWLEMGT